MDLAAGGSKPRHGEPDVAALLARRLVVTLLQQLEVFLHLGDEEEAVVRNGHLSNPPPKHVIDCGEIGARRRD